MKLACLEGMSEEDYQAYLTLQKYGHFDLADRMLEKDRFRDAVLEEIVKSQPKLVEWIMGGSK